MGKLEQLLAVSTLALGLKAGEAAGEPIDHSTAATKKEVVACMMEESAAIYTDISQSPLLAELKIEVRGKEKLFGPSLRVERPNGFLRTAAASSESGADPFVDFQIKTCDDGKFVVTIKDDNFAASFSASSKEEIADKIKTYMTTVSTLNGDEAVKVINANWLQR